MGAVSEFEYRYNMTMKIFHSHAEPAFETPQQQETVWGQQWGCDNDVGQLRKVLMHRPGDEMNIIDPSKRIEELGSYGDVEGQTWYWRGDVIPSLEEQQAQHDALADTLRKEGVEVVYLKRCAPATGTLASIGMPILRTVHGTGLMEGGSFAWLKPGIAAVGRSNRVNEEGTRQVEEVLKAQGCALLRVDLTGYRLHIDGNLVMIDVDTAIINPTQLPFWFLEKLKELGIRTIDVSPDDPSGAVNCIAVRPGRVVMEANLSPRTADKLDKLGIEIVDVKYDKIWLGGGGIHCSTSPLIRDSIG